MDIHKNRLKVYWLIALAGFLLRLVVSVSTGGLRHPQLFEYDWIAQSIMAGKGFAFRHFDITYYSFAAPFYSWLSAAAYWLFGSIVPVMLIQMAAGAILTVVTSLITERLHSGWIAPVAAGILVAIHPGLVLYSATKAHPLMFDALFFALALLQSFRLAERRTLKRFIIFGLIVGVGALSRATIVIFLPVTAVWLLAITPKPAWQRTIRHLIVAALCAAAAIAPWTIRNSLLHHQFVFMLTTDSEDFWRGNNVNATGHSYVASGQRVQDALTSQEKAELRSQPTEIAQARWFASQSSGFVRSHPGSFVRITFLKFLHFWWFAPQTGVLYSRSSLYLYMMYYVFALLLGALGLWRIIKVGPPATHFAALMLLFMFALSLLQSLYYVEGRHRWGIEPMILAFAGVGVATLINRIGRRRVSRT